MIPRYFFGYVDSVRPWLAQRLVLLLLAFDCWIELIPHAGRYGFGDFNVAHFALLDVLQPLPSPGTYIGAVVLAGTLALVQALTRPTRAGLGLACAAYTYAWAMSMLDSYQHHYLLSLVLFAMVFFPRLTSADVFPVPGDRSVVVGGALLTFGLAEIVLGLTGAESPLGLFGPGAALPTPAWIWLARVALALLGGLLAFTPKSATQPKASAGATAPSAPSAPSAAKSSEDEPKPRGAKGRGRKGKKQSKLQRVDDAAPSERPGVVVSAPKTVAWGYVLLGTSIAIVYFFTAISKLGADWRAGHALRRLGHTPLLEGLASRATTEGLLLFGPMSEAAFWKLLATGAILTQLAALVGYLLANRQDDAPPKLRRAILALGVAPLSFHLLAESGLTLEIGWFSYYMILFALIFFLPAPVLRVLAEGWSLPARWLAARPLPTAAAWGLVAAAVIALGVAGHAADLPGALVGAGIAAAFLLGDALWSARASAAAGADEGPAPKGAGERTTRHVGGLGLAGLLGALGFIVAISQSEVRFDYYRFVGGEHRRHGNVAEALEAYEKANEHVLRPHCLYDGRQLVSCHRTEARATALAEAHGLTVRARDRRREEAEMRMRLEARDGGESAVAADQGGDDG
ncbi:MAG: HTTM domain-containing protein [Myxococcales bacterium]|nr:HTTM domain-containing protein [Myxococcales bacterium]